MEGGGQGNAGCSYRALTLGSSHFQTQLLVLTSLWGLIPACDLGLRAQLPVNDMGCCRTVFAGTPCHTAAYEYRVLLLLTLRWPPGANGSEPSYLFERQREKCNCDLILGSSEMCLYAAQRWEGERQ